MEISAHSSAIQLGGFAGLQGCDSILPQGSTANVINSLFNRWCYRRLRGFRFSGVAFTVFQVQWLCFVVVIIKVLLVKATENGPQSIIDFFFFGMF